MPRSCERGGGTRRGTHKPALLSGTPGSARRAPVVASSQMALGDLTKQIAQQALLSATSKDPPPAPQPESLSAVILAELGRMQKALKEDEELVVFFQNGAERLRILEIFMPSRQLAVLSGTD